MQCAKWIRAIFDRRGRLHSQMDPASVSRSYKIGGREQVRLNPADAARRNIADGDVVRVFNTRGSCLAAATIDSDVMPSVAVMATGAWFDPAPSANQPERHGNPNVLTGDVGTSRLAQGTSALSALVDIERWYGALSPIRAWTPPRRPPLTPNETVSFAGSRT
jgi:biotin/methionine sulfoxide reductase